MVTKQQITEYLKGVPAMPESLRRTMDALNAGELARAAQAAADDQALMFYLRQVVNSAAFGFRNELSEASQIFSALGVGRAKPLLYAYMVSLMAPKTWRYFKIDSETFRHFQAEMMRYWEELVQRMGGEEKWLAAAAVMGAGLVVADGIFGDRKEDIALLTAHEDLDLDTILYRVSGMRFKDLVGWIAKRWEVDPEVVDAVALAFGESPCDSNELVCRLARALHLLLFYELSRPAMLEAGANQFLAFNPAFAEPVLESFQSVVEIA